MLINAIEAVVENGAIRLPKDVSLSENAKVYAITADSLENLSGKVRSPRLADPRQSADFVKQIVEPPANAKL